MMLTPGSHRRLIEESQVVSMPTIGSVNELADKVGIRFGGVDLQTTDKPGEHRVAVTLDIKKVVPYGE